MDRVVVNSFEKGMILDLDYTKIPKGRYLLAKDITIYNKEGKNYVITNIMGNIEAFSVTDGFVPVGCAVHRGIMYVLSAKDDGSGEGEIGCYPSPTGTGFTHTYKALQNYDGGDMRSSDLQFYPQHRVEVVTKSYFDSSVNIYFADGNNPFKVVNNGFKDDGSTGEISYTQANFNTLISLILYPNTSPKIDDFSVSIGGILKYGMYSFFIRHVTATLDGTTYYDIPGPIPVYDGNDGDDSLAGGNAELRSNKKITLFLKDVDNTYDYVEIAYKRSFSDYGGLPVAEYGIINKRYKITGSSMDVEISGNEGERLIKESELEMKPSERNTPKSITIVDKRLWGANWKRANTRNDLLSDFASKIKIKYYSTTLPDDVWMNGSSGTQFRNIGNHKYIGYFSGETYPFGVVLELNNGTYTQVFSLNGADAFANTSPDYTVGGADKGNKSGIYRFPGPHMVPVQGNDVVTVLAVEFDMVDAVVSIMGDNPNSWIRFNVRSLHFVRGERKKNLQAQGMMIMASLPYIKDATDPATPTTPTEDCSVHGKYMNYGQEVGDSYYDYTQVRFPVDIIFDDCFWGRKWYNHSGDQPQAFNRQFPKKYAPVYRSYMPAFIKDAGNLDTLPNGNYLTRIFAMPGKYGFYSPEFLFNEINDINDCNYIYRIGKTLYKHGDIVYHSSIMNIHDNRGIWDPTVGNEFIEITDHPALPTRVPSWMIESVSAVNLLYNDDRIKSIDNKKMIGEETLVQPGNGGYYDYINAVDEPYSSIENTWFWSKESDDDPFGVHHQASNRSMILAKYLGIDITETISSSDDYDNYNLDIVNIYKEDPTTVDILQYESGILSDDYKFIGDTVLLDVLIGYYRDSTLDLHPVRIYDGDCFTQRFYFRHMQWGGSKFLYGLGNGNWNDEDAYDRPTMEDKIKYSFGVELGFVVQSTINTALRGEYKDYSYWPKEDYNWISQAYPDYKENFALNKGYSVVLSNNKFRVYDENIPNPTINYLGTIAYSDADIPGSIIDPFRSFRSGNYKNFDIKYGSIVKLAEYFDHMVSVWEDGILEHFVNERIAMGQGQGSVYGYGDVLSDKTLTLAEYGSQNQFGVGETETGIYGVDWKRGIIWMVKGQYSSTGRFFLSAYDLTEKEMVKTWLYNILDDAVDGITDKTADFKDDTIEGSGIVVGYDPVLGDIYFTVLYKKDQWQ